MPRGNKGRYAGALRPALQTSILASDAARCQPLASQMKESWRPGDSGSRAALAAPMRSVLRCVRGVRPGFRRQDVQSNF